MSTERDDELGSEAHNAGVFDQQLEARAEVDDQSGIGGPVKLDLRESHVFAYCAACPTARCTGFGLVFDPPTLPTRRADR